ncbi:MAG: hypothetical protein JXR76_10020 [Deltaproteobacteria bacterium]|nr:hypothetical protein [Deltaproteobacteria bacterium]
MNQIIFAYLLAVCLLFGVGCQKASGVGTDTDTTTGTGLPGDTDDDSTATEPAGDSETQTAGDSETETVIPDSADTGQSPISFVIFNESSETKYMQFFGEPEETVHCAMNDVETCRFFAPPCSDNCADVTPDDYCLILCEYWPMVQAIEPGETLNFPWPGSLFAAQVAFCKDGGTCFFELPATAGEYTAAITVYNSVTCAFENQCTLDSDSSIHGGVEPSGEGVIVSASFTVPTSDDVVLTIVE